MTTLEIIVLALIQGLTEFLPISSSAHLILPSALLNWEEQGLAFDVAVHVGTLGAVVLYFRKEVADMWSAWIGTLKGDRQNPDGKLAWWIILSSIPLGLFGLLLNDFIDTHARSVEVLAATTIIFAIFLWIADARASQTKQIYDLNWKTAIMIGVSQALALIPGTSRSGITMTTGLMLGLTRKDAARFSFLLSIPAIVMAGGYEGLKLVTSEAAVDWTSIGLGTVLSFVSAYACIHYFLILVEKLGMLPFVIYRLLLGFALVGFIMW